MQVKNADQLTGYNLKVPLHALEYTHSSCLLLPKQLLLIPCKRLFVLEVKYWLVKSTCKVAIKICCSQQAIFWIEAFNVNPTSKSTF